MNIDSVLWNDKINISEKEYDERHSYLFDKAECLSEKLKKYNINSAQRDLNNELTSYHFFLAKARESFHNNITVYKIDNDIIDKIKNTKIEKMPDEIPAIFKKPFIIETLDQNTNLFGDINSMVGFFHKLTGEASIKLNSEYLLTILIHTQSTKNENWYQTAIKLNQLAGRSKIDFRYLGANLFFLLPPIKNNDWKFDRIDYSRNILMETTFCNQCTYKDECLGPAKPDLYCNYSFCYDGFCDNILSFITVLNYMLEAENTPIKINKKMERSNSVIIKKNKVTKKQQDWIIKYLYLDKFKIKYEKSLPNSELVKEGLVLKNVKVRGHLRYQAYGQKFKHHKWIYIESFTTTKWVNEGDTKIIVKTDKKQKS
jgi:hypothetical protein